MIPPGENLYSLGLEIMVKSAPGTTRADAEKALLREIQQKGFPNLYPYVQGVGNRRILLHRKQSIPVNIQIRFWIPLVYLESRSRNKMHMHRVHKCRFPEQVLAMMGDLILLPGNSTEVELIVREVHEANAHAAREHLVSLIRQRDMGCWY